MKKKQKKLSLEKFNVARLTNKMRYIYGGGTTQPTDHCHVTENCDPDPISNSSIECLVGYESRHCPSHTSQISATTN